METVTRKSKKALKCLAMPSNLKASIENYLGMDNVISMISVRYKNENFLVVTRNEKDVYSNKPNPKRYMELKALKEFISNDKTELKNWDNALEPKYIKKCMVGTITPQKIRTIRNVYKFTDLDVTNLSRIRSNVGTYRDVLEEIKGNWYYSDSGRKSEQRKDQRKVVTRSKRLFGNTYSSMVGGVHTEAGLYLRAYKEKMSKVLDFNKKPMTSERHIGLELEFCLPRINKEIIKESLVASPYANMLCLTRDGSVTSNDKYEPAELKICSPLSQLTDVVSYVCKVLTLHSCVVDTTCGLHVHLDARKDDVRAMFDKLLDQQSSLFALVPKSRRNNQYCRPTTKKDFRKGSRYKSINSTAYGKFQTLEVRLHGGTIDPNKIINWTLLLASIAYNEQKITKSRSIVTMLKKLTLGESMTSYLLERAAKFDTHGDIVASDRDASN